MKAPNGLGQGRREAYRKDGVTLTRSLYVTSDNTLYTLLLGTRREMSLTVQTVLGEKQIARRATCKNTKGG